MSKLELKPNHKPGQTYFETLRQFDDLSLQSISRDHFNKSLERSFGAIETLLLLKGIHLLHATARTPRKNVQYD